MNDEYDIPKTSKSLKKIVILAAAFLAVAVLVAVIYYFVKVNKPASSESREINFTVSKGLSTRGVANKLNDASVINNPTVFLIYSYLHDAGNKIQAGNYSLNSNMVIPEIIDVLTHGKVLPSDRKVTTIEGWTNKQVANYLISRQIIAQASDLDKILADNNFDFSAEGGSASGGKFAALAKEFNYQGFLFPDTYKLALDGTASDLVEKMLKNFENKITDQMLADAQSKSLTLKQVLVMASIIEKEVGRNKEILNPDDLAAMQKEREIVSSVFYNRLKIGMKLESDATVNYVTGKADRSVTIADSKVKSPYNTYVTYGLPPAPIGNPGLGAIIAAVYPANSDYLFFLNKPDGEAVFGKTLAEHNANKAKYLK